MGMYTKKGTFNLKSFCLISRGRWKSAERYWAWGWVLPRFITLVRRSAEVDEEGIVSYEHIAPVFLAKTN
jgi:hypothetical protein